MSAAQLAEEFGALAERLVSSVSPSDGDLRRAVSTAYYAAFHILAAACADQVVGQSRRDTDDWTTVFRGLDHRQLANTARLLRSRSTAWQILADALLSLYGSRLAADYDPANGRQTVAMAQAAVDDLATVRDSVRRLSPDERIHLVVRLLFRSRDTGTQRA